jgi:hypothetical protein
MLCLRCPGDGNVATASRGTPPSTKRGRPHTSTPQLQRQQLAANEAPWCGRGVDVDVQSAGAQVGEEVSPGDGDTVEDDQVGCSNGVGVGLQGQ